MKVLVKNREEYGASYSESVFEYRSFIDNYGGSIVEIREDKVYNGKLLYLIDCPITVSHMGVSVINSSSIKEVLGHDFRIGSSFCESCQLVDITSPFGLCLRCNLTMREFFPGTTRAGGFDAISDKIVSECFEGIKL